MSETIGFAVGRRRMVLVLLALSACSTQKNASVGGASYSGGGSSALRRLTQTEYNNTVRDLLGDTTQPAASFPADSRNLGFDNNQSTLTVPPVLVQRYESAAEALITAAWTKDGAKASATAKLRVCDPADATAASESACAQQILRTFARKAWRRPVTDDELAPLVKLLDVAKGEGDTFETGIQLALRAVLLSPNFIYRTETDTAADQPISDHALASRLSYFLWSSMPDDQLFSEADAGTLHTPEVLAAEVRRMLADSKAQALIDSFGAQWLHTLDMPLVSPDPVMFPQVTTSLKQAFHDEATLFFREFLTGDRSALDLLDADFTYLNQELAAFYGIPGVSGATMQRVQLPAGVNRGGLLRQAGFLTITSLMSRTSPVRRGKWVLAQLLCDEPPAPPPGIPALPSTTPAGATQRQLLEQHSQSASCAGCHQKMDAIGFALDNFDPVGQFRTQDNGATIDATATVEGQAVDGAAQLSEVLKADAALPACMAKTVYAYAVGRTPGASDQAALDQIAQAFTGSGARLSELFFDVATAPAFTGRCSQ